ERRLLAEAEAVDDEVDDRWPAPDRGPCRREEGQRHDRREHQRHPPSTHRQGLRSIGALGFLFGRFGPLPAAARAVISVEMRNRGDSSADGWRRYLWEDHESQR